MKKTLIACFAIVAATGVFLGIVTNGLVAAEAKTEFGNVNNVGEYISLLLPWISGIIGGLAVLMTIYAGYIYITSQGNPEGISQAKDIIIGVVTGIMLLFLINLIIRSIGFTV